MNRKHELFLINLGLETLLERMSTKVKPKVQVKPKKKFRKAKWSKAQHEKYAETMAKKWGKKNK